MMYGCMMPCRRTVFYQCAMLYGCMVFYVRAHDAYGCMMPYGCMMGVHGRGAQCVHTQSFHRRTVLTGGCGNVWRECVDEHLMLHRHACGSVDRQNIGWLTGLERRHRTCLKLKAHAQQRGEVLAPQHLRAHSTDHPCCCSIAMHTKSLRPLCVTRAIGSCLQHIGQRSARLPPLACAPATA